MTRQTGHISIDEIDHRLLDVLRHEGRISVNELAARTGVSRATAYTRFDRLRSTGVIRGFRADIDPAALGYDITALILVNVDQGEWRAALHELGELPGVEYVAVTSGTFDFVLLVRVPDVAALRDVLLVRIQGLTPVNSTQTIFVLGETGDVLGTGSFSDEQRRPAPATPARAVRRGGR